jgi:biopolymer transport protein ExbB
MEDLGAFTNDVHGYLASAGAVKPSMGAAAPTAQTRTNAAPTPRGTEPVRAGMTQTGQQATPGTTPGSTTTR